MTNYDLDRPSDRIRQNIMQNLKQDTDSKESRDSLDRIEAELFKENEKQKQQQSVKDTVMERGKTHGDFRTTAIFAANLKGIIDQADFISGDLSRRKLTAVQREALHMIATKIARILSGDPFEVDHWHDIQGYAELAIKDNDSVKAAPNGN